MKFSTILLSVICAIEITTCAVIFSETNEYVPTTVYSGYGGDVSDSAMSVVSYLPEITVQCDADCQVCVCSGQGGASLPLQ